MNPTCWLVKVIRHQKRGDDTIVNTSILRGVLLALMAAAIYAIVPNFVRLAFLNGVPALETVSFRTIAVALVLGIIAVLTRQSFKVPWAAWPSLVGQTCATLLVSVCYLASLQFIPVTLSVVIFYTFPLIILVGAPFIEGHVPNLARTGVAVLGFAGLWVALAPDFGQLPLFGLVLAFLGAIGCAMQFFTGRVLSRHMPSAAFGSLVHVMLIPVIVPLAYGLTGGSFALLGSAPVGPYALIAVAGACLAYVSGYFLHMSSVRAAPASVVAPFFNFEPLVTTTIAFLLLKETLTQNQMLGGAMVFAALLLGSLFTLRQKEPA